MTLLFLIFFFFFCFLVFFFLYGSFFTSCVKRARLESCSKTPMNVRSFALFRTIVGGTSLM